MEAMSYRYNRVMSNRFYEILDFINMHYCLTQRTDTDFWLEVQKPEHINDRLKAKLEYWAMKLPTPLDFEDQCFSGLTSNTASPLFNSGPVDTAGLWNHESYLCILHGMGFQQAEYAQKNITNKAQPQIFRRVIERLQEGQKTLPPHAIWLQNNVGMKTYQTASTPAGWRC
jgi:tryptophan halogenase